MNLFQLEAPVAPAPVAPAPQSPPRVLVVDDNRDAADSLAMLLEVMGYSCCVRYDGPAALAAAEAFRPDACLLDIGLPGMDGYELANRLRADPRHAGAVLVAVTGYGDEARRRRADRVGFDAYLTKPASPELVERALRALVRSGA